MKPNLVLGFFASAFALTLILTLASFDDRKAALLRLDELLSRDTEFKESIATHCHTLEGRQTSTDEKFILNHHAPSPRTSAGTGTKQNCFVSIQSSSRARFGLQGHWNFGLELKSDNGPKIFYKNYTIEFPRPRTLLPLALLFLAVIFEFPLWGWFSSLGLYLVLVAGGNPLHLLQLMQRALPVTLQTEGTLSGFLLLCGWVAIAANRYPKTHVTNPALMGNINQAKNFSAMLLGLWNPVAFTVSAPLDVVSKGAPHRLSFFFDAQILLTALSLYLLSFDMSELATNLFDNAFLPRYLTLSLFLFLLLPHQKAHRASHRLLIAPHSLLRAFICIVAFEAAEYLKLFPFAVPTLTRLAAALFLSEILWPMGVAWKRAARAAVLWMGTIFFAACLGVLLLDSGVPQMIFGLVDPRMHPTAMVFFTFLPACYWQWSPVALRLRTSRYSHY